MGQVELLNALLIEKREQRVIQDSEDEISSQHLIFLSHFKLEAGTEAALMRAELEHVLRAEGSVAMETFNAPIFLDSEDLYDLEDLQARVRQSHNLVLLLTHRVLSRPWVLVELVTAVSSSVR